MRNTLYSILYALFQSYYNSRTTHLSNDLVVHLFIRERFSILSPTIGTFSYSAMRATF